MVSTGLLRSDLLVMPGPFILILKLSVHSSLTTGAEDSQCDLSVKNPGGVGRQRPDGLLLHGRIAIYKKRWEIETLFRQIKQNFPLRYFYGESANAIKIQIWVTLIANLLLTLMQRSLKRKWSFSGLATMTRILLMCYVDYRMFFENPERDWQQIQAGTPESPPELELEFE